MGTYLDKTGLMEYHKGIKEKLANTSALSLKFQTTAPTSDNTSDLKVVVLASEPETKYSGWLYIITG